MFLRLMQVYKLWNHKGVSIDVIILKKTVVQYFHKMLENQIQYSASIMNIFLTIHFPERHF